MPFLPHRLQYINRRKHPTMKILLLGEYSNLHWTLAKGLRTLGHDVVVASDGDGFKNYRRDVDISLKNNTRIGQIKCLTSIVKSLPLLKGFDIVQLINPIFTRIHPVSPYLYRFLKKYNHKIFLGAFGNDYFYTKACLENKIYRHSEFFVNNQPINLQANFDLKHAWISTYRQRLNQQIANECNGIIAGLCEYYMAYETEYKEKLSFIPFPIDLSEIEYNQLPVPEKIIFFLGINKERMEIKGLDIFLKVLKELEVKYGNQIGVHIAESIPYEEYRKRMQQAHVVLDQTYGYSVAMNGLLSLAQGKILVGNAEPEMYGMMGENSNHPIVNITPSFEDIYKKMECLIQKKNYFPEISKQGRLFVEDNHAHINIAEQYLKIWEKQ